MFRSVLTAILLMTGLPCAFATGPEALSYKGVKLGATSAEFQEKLPDYKCSGHCSYEQKACFGHSAGLSQEAYAAKLKACDEGASFGGVPISDGFATIRDGVFANLILTIDTAYMDHLLSAVETRYGKPTETSDKPFANGYGAQLRNWQKTWKVGSDQMVLTLRSGRADQGSVKLVSAAMLKAIAEQKTKQAQQGSKDF